MRTQEGNELIEWFDQEIKTLEMLMRESAFAFTEKQDVKDQVSYLRNKAMAEKLTIARQKAVRTIATLEGKIEQLTPKEPQE